MTISEIFYLLSTYGYVGAFMVSFLGTSSIFIVVPFYAIIFAMSKFLDPVLLITVSTLGSTCGEFVGYGIGYGGRRFLEKKYKKYFQDSLVKPFGQRSMFYVKGRR